jgi:hypothetical protein
MGSGGRTEPSTPVRNAPAGLGKWLSRPPNRLPGLPAPSLCVPGRVVHRRFRWQAAVAHCAAATVSAALCCCAGSTRILRLLFHLPKNTRPPSLCAGPLLARWGNPGRLGYSEASESAQDTLWRLAHQLQQLADVKQWQRDLQVRLDLRATQAGMDEYRRVQHNSAIRSKSGSPN